MGTPLAEPVFEPPAGEIGQVLVARCSRRDLVRGEVVRAHGDFQVAALGDLHRIAERLLHFAEHRPHFVGRLEVELVARVLEAVLLADRLSRSDADQAIVGVGVGLSQVVAVVRGHEGQTFRARQADHLAVDEALSFGPVVLELEIEVSFAQDVLIRAGHPDGLVETAGGQICGDLPAQARGEADQSLGVGREDLLVDPGAVVEPFQVTGGHELDQVPVSLLVPREEDHVIRGLVDPLRGLLESARGGDVNFASDDRLDARFSGRLVEFDGPEEISVVREGHGRHLEGVSLPDDVRHSRGGVEEGILAVKMKVNEVSVAHGMAGHAMMSD